MMESNMIMRLAPLLAFFLAGCASSVGNESEQKKTMSSEQENTHLVSRGDLYLTPKDRNLNERIWASEIDSMSKNTQNKEDVDFRHLKSKDKERNEPYKMGDIKKIPNSNAYCADPSKW